MKTLPALAAVALASLSLLAAVPSPLFPEPEPRTRLSFDGFVGDVRIVGGSGEEPCPWLSRVDMSIIVGGGTANPELLRVRCTFDSGASMPCECQAWEPGDLVSITDAELHFITFHKTGEHVYWIEANRGYRHRLR